MVLAPHLRRVLLLAAAGCVLAGGAVAEAEEATRLVEASGSPQLEPKTLNVMGWAYWSLGAYERTLDLCTRARERRGSHRTSVFAAGPRTRVTGQARGRALQYTASSEEVERRVL